MDFNTKRELLTSVVETLYEVSSISFNGTGLDRYSYHVNKVKFNKKGEERFEKVFRYTFIEKKPVYDNPQRQKKEEPIPRIPTFKRALMWLRDFFKMGIVPESLIKRQDEELDAWGKKLYDCYMDLIDVLFLDRGSGEDEKIDCEVIRNKLSNVIKERLLGQKDCDGASTPCIPQAYKVDSKPSPREIAAILGTKTSLDSLVAKVPKGRFGELPHKEELPQEVDYMYNYEDFNRDIDNANNTLSRLSKELDEHRLFSLNNSVSDISTKLMYFKENLSFEKKQHTLNVLKSTLERFFKEEETQQEPLPKPNPDTVTRYELWLYEKRTRTYHALKASIDKLKRLTDHETQDKIPLTGTPEEKAMICLKKAGWYDGRSVDLSEVKAFYESGGITLPTGAENFLKEYYGLNDEWALYEVTENGLQETGRFIFKLYPMSDSPYDNDRYFDDEYYSTPFQDKVEAFAEDDLVYIGDIGYKYPAKVYLGNTGKIYTEQLGLIRCYDSVPDILINNYKSVSDESTDSTFMNNFKYADNWEYVTMRRY